MEYDEIRYINIDRILYLDCVDKKVFAYTREDVYPLEETLSHYEALLSDYGFTRISKSNIVNIFQIKAMKSEINMRICATFENKEKIYINRSYKKSFMDYLVNMRGCINEKYNKRNSSCHMCFLYCDFSLCSYREYDCWNTEQ